MDRSVRVDRAARRESGHWDGGAAHGVLKLSSEEQVSELRSSCEERLSAPEVPVQPEASGVSAAALAVAVSSKAHGVNVAALEVPVLSEASDVRLAALEVAVLPLARGVAAVALAACVLFEAHGVTAAGGTLCAPGVWSSESDALGGRVGVSICAGVAPPAAADCAGDTLASLARGVVCAGVHSVCKAKSSHTDTGVATGADTSQTETRAGRFPVREALLGLL